MPYYNLEINIFNFSRNMVITLGFVVPKVESQKPTVYPKQKIIETHEYTEMEKKQTDIGEIEETVSNSDGSPPHPNSRTVKTKIPQVEIHLFRRGKGPIDVFKSDLAGWEQDQLEVRNILEKYGFKSLFAFNPGSGRGVPIRFHPRNGRSLLPYKDGSVVYVDGEPKVNICF